MSAFFKRFEDLDLNLQSPLSIDIDKLNQMEQKKMKKRDPALPPPVIMPQVSRTDPKQLKAPPQSKPKPPLDSKPRKEQIFLDDEEDKKPADLASEVQKPSGKEELLQQVHQPAQVLQ